MSKSLNKITNILAFNFVCTNSFLFDGNKLDNDPTYILEKWSKHCGFTPKEEYVSIFNQNPDFLKFKEEYNKTWNNQNIDRWLEYFWSIRKSADIELIVNRFEYYFGSATLVADTVCTGVHPILKTSINDLIDSANSTKVLRDMNLDELI
jgi:hypothetical protein